MQMKKMHASRLAISKIVRIVLHQYVQKRSKNAEINVLSNTSLSYFIKKAWQIESNQAFSTISFKKGLCEITQQQYLDYLESQPGK